MQALQSNYTILQGGITVLLYATIPFAKWLGAKTLQEPLLEGNDFVSWRANYAEYEGKRVLVFMHEATRYVVVVVDPSSKHSGSLEELFFDALRGTLLADNINPDVIERYMSECGGIDIVRNVGRRQTVWLNKAADNVWFSMRDFSEGVALGIAASHTSVDPVAGGKYEDRVIPAEKFYEMLGKYDLPIRAPGQ